MTNKKTFFSFWKNLSMSEQELRKLSYETGFTKRVSKKIDAIDFLTLMCLESQKESPSFNHMAARIDTIRNTSVSKQAIGKKYNENCVAFFQAVLSRVIQSKITESVPDLNTLSKKYKRLIIQDSTIIKLPFRLFNFFSGVSNAYYSVCNVRIQCVYELLSGRFLFFR